jgi:hypothetical protein
MEELSLFVSHHLCQRIDDVNRLTSVFATNEALQCGGENDQVLDKPFDGCRFFEVFDVTLDFSFFLFIL